MGGKCMKMKRAEEYRGIARGNLKGNWGTAIVVCLIVLLISGVMNFIPIAGSIISIILVGPFAVAELRYFIKLHKKEKATVGSGFADFGKDFTGNVGAYILQSIYLFLWTLLLIIPGLIKSYSYSMTMFLKAKNPEMKANDAITLSRKIMYGKKWKLFCLDVSFIGWAILSIFTLGIGLIFLIPYINASHVAFFEDAYIAYQSRSGNIIDVKSEDMKDGDSQIEVE